LRPGCTGRRCRAAASHQLAPDFAAVHQELKRPGVTLQLLWEEYARGNTLAYKYTSFCVKYRAWAMGLKRSMRQTHIAGEKLFVDYAGQTVPLVDAATGEITAAQIFVATLGASNYTYACATARQTTADWIGAQVRALEFSFSWAGGGDVVPTNRDGLAVQAVLEDRGHAAVGRRADRQRPGAGCLQSGRRVLARKALQAQAGAVALLGVRAVFELPSHHRGRTHADATAPVDQCAAPTTTTDTTLSNHPLKEIEDVERTHPGPTAQPAPGRHGARHRGADREHRGERSGVR
jgi:hypothetical protein